MNYLQSQRNPLRYLPALLAVAALHVAVIHALSFHYRKHVEPPPLPAVRVHVILASPPPAAEKTSP